MSLYEILNIDPTSTKEQIKKAYRNLAHKFHPDKEGGDNDKFTDINKAYAVLIDDTARNRYDETGQSDKIDIRKAAQDAIISIFIGVIETNPDDVLIRMDIIKFIQKSINENMGNVKVNIKKIGKDKKRLSKLLNRIKRKNKKNNIFNAVLGARIDGLNRSAKAGSEQLKMWGEALNILAEYKDDKPEQDDFVGTLERDAKRAFKENFMDVLKKRGFNFGI